MNVPIALMMILAPGLGLTISDLIYDVPFQIWQDLYSIVRDIQFIGFALLAFGVCPYRRVELKMATFFMVLWRFFIFVVNSVEIEQGKALWTVAAIASVYLVWLFRAMSMGAVEEEDQPGAYMFLMPIHSGWGLMKAIFMPWEMARYESVVMVDGDTAYFVHGREFTMRKLCDTNLMQRPGAKRHLGRPLTLLERLKFKDMVGTRAIPGIRDCRKLEI